MVEPLLLTALAAAGLMAAFPKVRQRLELSLAKHPSLTGHSRMAKRVAAQVPGYCYDEAGFFGSDGAPAEVQAGRRAGLMRLAGQLTSRHAKSIALTQRARAGEGGVTGLSSILNVFFTGLSIQSRTQASFNNRE